MALHGILDAHHVLAEVKLDRMHHAPGERRHHRGARTLPALGLVRCGAGVPRLLQPALRLPGVLSPCLGLGPGFAGGRRRIEGRLCCRGREVIRVRVLRARRRLRPARALPAPQAIRAASHDSLDVVVLVAASRGQHHLAIHNRGLDRAIGTRAQAPALEHEALLVRHPALGSAARVGEGRTLPGAEPHRGAARAHLGRHGGLERRVVLQPEPELRGPGICWHSLRWRGRAPHRYGLSSGRGVLAGHRSGEDSIVVRARVVIARRMQRRVRRVPLGLSHVGQRARFAGRRARRLLLGGACGLPSWLSSRRRPRARRRRLVAFLPPDQRHGVCSTFGFVLPGRVVRAAAAVI
mmetsp:Transcript_1795/g.7190  ORF Transcript_1795/g.7190 Transcript_1795/m.7190 type:complete len:351 (+) Transcript_1795:1480-2532(+)